MHDDEPLGLGLIGCGTFGLFCLNVFSKMDQVCIAAVADVREEAAESFGREFSVPAYRDSGELIADENVQIVHIATPPSSHYELVLAAARAGKNVLCEKPLAMDLHQADELLAATTAAGTIAPVNLVLRYNAVTEAVKRIIDSGLLGQVLAGRVTNCAKDTPLGPDHWFWDKTVSGGIFVEHGVHFFDLYRYWLGQGRVIDAHAETRPGTAQEDRVMCSVRHDNGALISHYHGFDQLTIMDRTTHHLVCELGDIRVSGWIPLELTVDAAVNDAGAKRLAELCGGAEMQVIETVEPADRNLPSRGVARTVTQRVGLRYLPNDDKQAVYTAGIRELLADQIAFIRDRTHVRRITESNGREALALAESAVKLARRQA